MQSFNLASYGNFWFLCGHLLFMILILDSYCNRYSGFCIIQHYGQATPSEKRTQKRYRFIGFIVFPVYLPHQAKAISLVMLLAIGYKTFFAVISREKSLSLLLWCGLTIRLNSLISLIFGSKVWTVIGLKLRTLLNRSIFLVSQISTLLDLILA